MSNLPRSYPNAQYFGKRLLDRRRWLILLALVLSVIFTGIFLLLQGNPIIPIGVMLSIVLIALVWISPRVVFYVMLFGACMIETYPLSFKDSVTDSMPLFWDVNTIVQIDFKLVNFHGIAFSFFEILLIIAGAAWLIKGVFLENLRIRPGTLLLPILMYVLCVIGGLFNGMATGGQFNIALFEVRAQIYFLFAYLMAVNCARNPERQLTILLWCMALAIGAKGLICTYRFLFTLKGVTIPEIGIGAHEESFFFDCFIFEYVVLKVAGLHPKLRRTMLILLPAVLTANLANERRAATAAIAIALIALLPLAAVAFPKRRVAISATTIIICVVTAIYLPLFWNKTGAIAQPARAIKSQFSPDPRDASSNAYRDAENENLLYTMKISPIIGFGYGKPIYIVDPMEDLTKVDPLVHFMTHNQILWVWMWVGCVGFYFFWLMICSIIIQACQLLRNPNATTEVRAGALLTVLIIIMQMVFGLLDLQITNVRNMLFCGLWTGMIGAFTVAYADKLKVTSSDTDETGRQIIRSRWNLPARGPVEP
jgi:hypothetical protein